MRTIKIPHDWPKRIAVAAVSPFLVIGFGGLMVGFLALMIVGVPLHFLFADDPFASKETGA